MTENTNNQCPPSKTIFNYNGHEIVVDGAAHAVYIDGAIADGENIPVGAVVSRYDIENPMTCYVRRTREGNEEEKAVPYGAPLEINEPVLIVGSIVIPAALMVHNYLKDDYGYWSHELTLFAEQIKNELETKKSEIQLVVEQINTSTEEIGQYAETVKQDISEYSEELRVGIDLAGNSETAALQNLSAELKSGIHTLAENKAYEINLLIDGKASTAIKNLDSLIAQSNNIESVSIKNIQNAGTAEMQKLSTKGDEVIRRINEIITVNETLVIQLKNYYTKSEVDAMYQGLKKGITVITDEMIGNLRSSITVINDEMLKDEETSTNE